jgi:hypothetical protein
MLATCMMYALLTSTKEARTLTAIGGVSSLVFVGFLLRAIIAISMHIMGSDLQ